MPPPPFLTPTTLTPSNWYPLLQYLHSNTDAWRAAQLEKLTLPGRPKSFSLPNFNRIIALDVHSSGWNEEWHRTQIGEILYQAKYKGHIHFIPVLAASLARCLKKHFPTCDYIVHAPSSSSRKLLPLISQFISGFLNMPHIDNLFSLAVPNSSPTPIKNIALSDKKSAISDRFILIPDKVASLSGHILIIDDLLESGSTLSVMAELLKDQMISPLSLNALTCTVIASSPLLHPKFRYEAM